MQRTATIFIGIALPVLFAACGPATPPGPDGQAEIVVGLTSDMRPGVDVQKVHVLAQASFETLPTPIITRTVHTSALANRKLLLKVPLDSHCALSQTAPVCNAPLTCISGKCADDGIDPSTLPDYTPDWMDVG